MFYFDNKIRKVILKPCRYDYNLSAYNILEVINMNKLSANGQLRLEGYLQL